jgi:hypothetical protein
MHWMTVRERKPTFTVWPVVQFCFVLVIAMLSAPSPLGWGDELLNAPNANAGQSPAR